MFVKIKIVLSFLLFTSFIYSQEGIPVYSDYLTDNYYLIHPSMAGASNCAKLRLTSRKQWFGQDNAPQLSTVSFNGRVTDNVGAGVILFNDKNGYHSQQGIKLTYAYHLMFSRNEIDLNQLSFGVSAGLIQNKLDESSFTGFDPIVFNQVQNDSYFNMDLGMSYNFLNFYVHATVQGLLETRRKLYTEYESNNLKKYFLSTGYVFGNKKNILWEPSVMYQMTSQTKEQSIDLNLKAYKALDIGTLWGGFSYRRSLDGVSSGNNTKQILQLFTPIIGLNYNNFMFAYTYSQLTGPIKFDNGAYHQITLGINLFCKKEKYDCNCPAIN